MTQAKEILIEMKSRWHRLWRCFIKTQSGLFLPCISSQPYCLLCHSSTTPVWSVFNKEEIIIYKHDFNAGHNYDQQSSIFVVPHSSVYTLLATIYGDGWTTGQLNVSANLQIDVASALHEQNSEDLKDSSTIVTIKWRLLIILPKGCLLCDHSSHYNTFTVFLLYTHWDSKKKHLLVFTKTILCGKGCFFWCKPAKQILKVNSSTRKIPQN